MPGRFGNPLTGAARLLKDRPGVPLESATPDSWNGRGRTVLFVANTEAFGGAEKHLLELIHRLGRSGVHSSILCLGPDFYTERLNRDGIEGVKIRHQGQPQSFGAWLRALREPQSDIIVFVCGWIASFPWYAYLTARLAGARKVCWLVHLTPDPVPANVEGRPLRNLASRLIGGQVRMRLAACLCQKIICVSDKIRDTLVEDYRFPARRTITVHNGISLSAFAPSDGNRATVRTTLGIGEGECLLVCAARLSEVKRVDILLRAMARVLSDGVSCKCVIVGDGPLREQLHEQALAIGLSGFVFFEGFKEDVRPYLQSADVFVLTSSQEGLPIAVLEAMACGLPCLVTDVGGNAEAVIHNVNGLVVPQGAVDEIAAAISYMATHPRERAQMSRMARARVCEVFDIESRMAEMMEVVLH